MLSWAVGAGTALEDGDGSGWSEVVSDEDREEQGIGMVGCAFGSNCRTCANQPAADCCESQLLSNVSTQPCILQGCKILLGERYGPGRATRSAAWCI
eukprot:COSAG02_NODE_2605_length_8442_cov_9.552080_12_plen_97_part_00